MVRVKTLVVTILSKILTTPLICGMHGIERFLAYHISVYSNSVFFFFLYESIEELLVIIFFILFLLDAKDVHFISSLLFNTHKFDWHFMSQLMLILQFLWSYQSSYCISIHVLCWRSLKQVFWIRLLFSVVYLWHR